MGTPARKTPVSRAPRGGKAAKHRNGNSPILENRPASLAVNLQQSILDIFMQAFPAANRHYDTKAVIQEVKGHLFDRNFEAAFSRPDYLEVYAARWSAARALAYADIFGSEKRQTWFQSVSAKAQQSIPRLATPSLPASVSNSNLAGNTDVSRPTTPPTIPLLHHGCDEVRIVCIGGGAGAEIIAFAALQLHGLVAHSLDILAIDIADWTIPVQKLSNAATTPLQSSNNANLSIKDSNGSFIDNKTFSVAFLQKDILDLACLTLHSPTSNVRGDEKQLGDFQSNDNPMKTQETQGEILQPGSSPFSNADLVTIMFTLNELFSMSLSKTTALLLHMTETLSSGAHLVVVDSPGSYSEIKLGKAEVAKKYPMKWLLDHTLLDIAGEGKWTKVESEDSVWFRLDNKGKHLEYPIELENCRYQIHVYQKS